MVIEKEVFKNSKSDKKSILIGNRNSKFRSKDLIEVPDYLVNYANNKCFIKFPVHNHELIFSDGYYSMIRKDGSYVYMIKKILYKNRFISIEDKLSTILISRSKLIFPFDIETIIFSSNFKLINFTIRGGRKKIYRIIDYYGNEFKMS